MGLQDRKRDPMAHRTQARWAGWRLVIGKSTWVSRWRLLNSLNVTEWSCLDFHDGATVMAGVAGQDTSLQRQIW